MVKQHGALVADPAPAYSQQVAGGSYLSRLGHELRSPLSSVQGLARIMRTNVAAGRIDPQRLHRQLELIESSAAEMLHTVERVADLVRVDTGPTPTRQPFDAHTTVAAVAAEARSVAERHGRRLVVHAPDAAVPVVGDETSLRMILAELLDNAVRYTTGDEVTIRLRPGPVDTLIEVTDAGPGIPPEEQTDIFAPFVRGSAASDGGMPGCGLGLTLAQRLAEHIAARLSVHSEPSSHTTFTVVMPTSSPPRGEPAA